MEYLGEIKNHWVKNFFIASLLLEKLKIHQIYEKYCINYLNGLHCFFNDSVYILNQLAHLFYHNKDQEISLEIFEYLLKIDPYRIENLDTYSNILYVRENQKELGLLAANCYENMKYCPETSCVIGNYLSLMAEHTKAIIYFKKALELDRNFLSACTLIGHEYLELKEVPNAIDAYNSALNIDPTDFRAWYGLGQAYELQSMVEFSLFYFGKAVLSRPRDYRMWNALASCYDKLGKKEEATKCYERAESFKDKEGIALFNLGKMYDLMEYKDKAAQSYEENLRRSDKRNMLHKVNIFLKKKTGYILIYLSNFYINKGNLNKAHEFASRLYDLSTNDREEAQNLNNKISMIAKENSGL